MNNVHSLLPRMVVNGALIHELLASPAPCFALGLVEERKQQSGFLAVRPKVPIPHAVVQDGFRFGHSLLGNSKFEVVHFVFEFYDYASYNVLLNPNNPVVKTVLNTMVERADYGFLVIDDSGSASAFRSELGQDNLCGLKSNMPRIQGSKTTDSQYENAITFFQTNPDPPGTLLNWVCRDNPACLDLTQERLELTPAPAR
jgi:hypothetical protein